MEIEPTLEATRRRSNNQVLALSMVHADVVEPEHSLVFCGGLYISIGRAAWTIGPAANPGHFA